MGNGGCDVVIIGGGITGAGIFRELSATGLDVCLLEQGDFGSGTSSKSSKLVHGGLRYLKQGDLLLTLESVHHRERLLQEAPGLVEPVEFVMPLYQNRSPGKFSLGAGLFLYDLMALKKRHSFSGPGRMLRRLPGLKPEGLTGGYSFLDATTDDALLVARLVHEGLKFPKASARNYCTVSGIVPSSASGKRIVQVKDGITGNERELETKLVINATGIRADRFHPLPDRTLRIRPLKGSHILVKKTALDLPSAVSLIHPADGRPVFLIPWEGVLLVGTTDLDAGSSTDLSIRANEREYLLEGVKAVFPESGIEQNDIVSSFSGLRPVISRKDAKPSDESREHLVWESDGIISATGGKLTTFRKLAWDVVKKAKSRFPHSIRINRKTGVFPAAAHSLNPVERRILGRYGGPVDMKDLERRKLLVPVGHSETVLAEIEIASGDPTVRHLDDLMLRRLRLGIVLENGGMDIMDTVKKLAGENLGWDAPRWEREIERYRRVHRRFFSPFPEKRPTGGADE